jgi:hypothetical protein
MNLHPFALICLLYPLDLFTRFCLRLPLLILIGLRPCFDIPYTSLASSRPCLVGTFLVRSFFSHVFAYLLSSISLEILFAGTLLIFADLPLSFVHSFSLLLIASLTPLLMSRMILMSSLLVLLLFSSLCCCQYFASMRPVSRSSSLRMAVLMVSPDTLPLWRIPSPVLLLCTLWTSLDVPSSVSGFTLVRVLLLSCILMTLCHRYNTPALLVQSPLSLSSLASLAPYTLGISSMSMFHNHLVGSALLHASHLIALSVGTPSSQELPLRS